MDLALNGKTAIVTGASRGIGRAIARELANEGMRVTVVARSGALLEELAATFPAPGLVQAVDLRDPDAPAKVVAATVERFGGVDLVVNNAGATVRGDFLALSDADWADGFALKFYGAMRLCRAAWPHLKEARGSIVNIVGIGGRTGSAEFTIGGAVNAAILNLTKALADRGTAEGVRVNAINPGSIETDRLRGRIDKHASDHSLTREAAAAEIAREMKVERFGRPEEIAALVAFLASPRAGYCVGAVVDADGGATRTL